MPASCPSFHLNFSAYLPTGVTSTGRGGASYITRSVCGLGLASPGFRPLFSRSSWHVAQGQAFRSHAKFHWLWCPSFQSISTPVPSVFITRIFAGVTASTDSFASSASRCACWELTILMPSWLIDLQLLRDQ